MRDFLFDTRPLLTPEIVRLLTEIHEHKGKQTLYIDAHADILSSLLKNAKIQSTGASNRIEGIHTSDERLKAIVDEKAEPRNRSEEEIAGYRKVLETIHDNYLYIPPTPSVILQFHRALYSYSPYGNGGHWKNSENSIVETDEHGRQTVRFQPLSAFETPEAMDCLCRNYNQAIAEDHGEPLLLTIQFILDFLCIHPFNDGNGRISRLLTLLLLYRGEYFVGKYISMEMLIEKNKEGYYESLKSSSQGWLQGTNTSEPFVRYMLGILLAAYRDFSARVESARDKSVSKPERIRRVFEHRLDPLSRQELGELCPDISEATMKNTLVQLVREGYLQKLGAARATKYIRTHSTK